MQRGNTALRIDLQILRIGDVFCNRMNIDASKDGNAEGWIEDAMQRAFRLVRGHMLDVRIVNYGNPPSFELRLEQEFK